MDGQRYAEESVACHDLGTRDGGKNATQVTGNYCQLVKPGEPAGGNVRDVLCMF